MTRYQSSEQAMVLFVNQYITEFCTSKGIQHQLSSVRTPQQNGVAERKNITLKEAARSMLDETELSGVYWVEAVNTACYTQNRCLITKSHNKTPYELFVGRSQNICNQILLGEKCLVIVLQTTHKEFCCKTW